MTHDEIRNVITGAFDSAGGDAGIPECWMPVLTALLSDPVISSIGFELDIAALKQSLANARESLTLLTHALSD